MLLSAYDARLSSAIAGGAAKLRQANEPARAARCASAREELREVA